MLKVVNADGYKVVIGKDALTELRAYIETAYTVSTKVFILTDENTYEHCLPILLDGIPLLEDAEIIEIPSGEVHKNIDMCVDVWSVLTEKEADRRSLLINLGGGVIGDMGGFIASTFKRGFDFINVPTTLLSQVDASVGGKLGIDFDGYKNHIGLFANPQGVFVYPPLIDTLDKRQVISGFAEIIKHALITDKAYWEIIKKTDINDLGAITDLIYKSVQIKNNIVLEDPLEKGARKALNFGHTIGHAIESYSLENNTLPLIHGEAIAIGMVAESYISYSHKLITKAELDEITAFIRAYYQPYMFKNTIYDQLIALMQNDKKNVNSTINFTLLKGIGTFAIDQKADTTLIKESLDYYRAELVSKSTLN